MTEDSERRLIELEYRIKVLEGAAETRPGKLRIPYIGDWGDVVKFIGLPLSLILGCLTFYDQVWTRAEKTRAKEAQAIETRLRELQDLNAKFYAFNADGQDGQSAALAEAMRGRLDRLTGEVFAFWQTRPDYFTWSERQSLANDLLIRGRTDDALAIANGLDEPGMGLIETADLALFRARILSAEGPVQNLDAARAEIKSGLGIANGLDRQVPRLEMIAKIAFYGLYMELWNETGCDKSGPLAEILADALEPEEISLGVLEDQATQLQDTHAARCP